MPDYVFDPEGANVALDCVTVKQIIDFMSRFDPSDGVVIGVRLSDRYLVTGVEAVAQIECDRLVMLMDRTTGALVKKEYDSRKLIDGEDA